MRPAVSILVFASLVSLFGQPMATVWDGVYTNDQSGRDTLGGGEEAPPLTGSAFMANWSGLTVGDLFERIRLSMPEGRPGTLSRQQNADILAYILNVNQFPAGKAELQRDTDRLKQIRFLAEKPEPGK